MLYYIIIILIFVQISFVMKKRSHIIVGILTSLSVLSCDDQFSIHQVDEVSSFITKSGSITPYYSSDKSRIVYPDEIDFYTWSHIGPIEERLKACEIPPSLASSMTTASLVESILFYPLNYLVHVYNDPLFAVNMIIDNSSLHRELLQRGDAAKYLIIAFSDTRPSRQMDRRKITTEKGGIPFQDEMFLDYLIASKDIQGIKSEANLTELKTALEIKADDIRLNPKRFSKAALKSLRYLDFSLGFRLLDIEPDNNNRQYLGRDTVYTPFGKPIEGYYSTVDFDDDDIEEINDFYLSLYPDVILHGNSSSRYNCHSFAWHQSDITNCYWIDYCDSNEEEQISKYYTDDFYEETTLMNYATHVRYLNADHSAIILPSGKFLSKWQDGPLVEHDWWYSPYSVLDMHYYKAKSLPLSDTSSTITGPSWVSPNVSNTFYISPLTNPDITYNISCEYISSNNPNACSFISTGSNYYSLICYEYGAYKISVNGYRAGYHYSRKEYLVICADGY